MSQKILRTEKCEMCNTSSQIERQRRINGLQLPFNGQQIISWIVLLTTAVINFSVLTLIQSYKMKISSFIIFGILYIVHIAFHVVALAIDPAEEDIRNRKTIEVPEFDRSLHAHVIENGRCHICNTYTSNGKTKHCGLCNKCVYEFDHHCKWLNNCIGKRNYFAFIGCVTTAFLISIFTSILCLVDIIVFLSDPQELSSEAQQYFDCNSIDTSHTIKYCKNSITFLTFLVILGISGLAMGYTMFFLCIFHAYLSLLGLSTYEYIIKNGDKKDSTTKRFTCCSKMYLFNRRKKDESDTPDKDNFEPDALQNRNNSNIINKNERNITNLMNIMIDKELKRAKTIFSPVKNKVHPQQNGEASEDLK